MTTLWFGKDEILPAVARHLLTVDVVLDIGCGIQPQTLLQPKVHICCEPFQQYVDALQKKVAQQCDQCDRTFLVLHGKWSDAVRIFPPSSVDTVFLLDVIEHLDKDEALALLEATKPIPRRQLVIFTPLGFLPQCHPDGKDAWGLDGGHWQEHRSGWQPEDFGPEWQVFACKEFHFVNNLGQPFPTPFGAMWAIRTEPLQTAPAPRRTRERLRQQLRAQLLHTLDRIRARLT